MKDLQECIACHKLFNTQEKVQKYCSRDCYNKNRIAWNKGKKLHYMPPNCYKKGQNIGEKHPRWKGGMIFFWKKQALERDNYQCRMCGLREPEIMDVAHIDPVLGQKNRMTPGFAKNDLDNLIILCPNDHRRFDKGIIKLADILDSINSAKSVKP